MRRLGRSGLLGAAFALVATACGGGDTAATRPTSTEPAAAITAPASVTTVPPVTSPEQLAAPKDPGAVVAVLTRVERALRSDDRDPKRLAVLGWEQQLAYGALVGHPEWQPTVLAALPEDVREIARTNVDAGNALTAPDLGPPLPSLPDWTILPAKPAATLVGFYREAESAYGIPWYYLAAIHFVETKMGRIHGNSSAGAQGPMQFIPSTWATFGEGDINDDHDAIRAAAHYLAASGGPKDMDRALFAYNPSRAYVTAIEKYASVIAADPRAYDGYLAWQVYVATVDGVRFLPEGWRKA